MLSSFTPLQILFWSLAAVLGVFGRYGFEVFFVKILGSSFWSGTLAANLVGAFLIGLFYAVKGQFSDEFYFGIVFCFLGSLTTFSTFSLQASQFIEGDRSLISIFSFLFGVPVLSLIFVFLGQYLGRILD